MSNPIYEKIEESIGEILSSYIWQINTPETIIEIKNSINEFLNETYGILDEVYVTDIYEDDNGAIQLELNPNGIIKTRNDKIDDILDDEF